MEIKYKRGGNCVSHTIKAKLDKGISRDILTDMFVIPSDEWRSYLSQISFMQETR